MTKDIRYRSAVQFVVLLGIVSLLADVTYEGARSITGPFLAVLGAPAAVVGIVAGAGELIGYALRLISGYLADRTGRYWAMTILGYTVNLLAVPALSLAGHWGVAAFLIVFERFGKAIRTPARDAMLAHATTEMGRGWGFALHEAMDQIGAVLGPIVIASTLYITKGQYQTGFAILLIPALLALTMLMIARALYPHPRDLEIPGTQPPAIPGKGFPRIFWLYIVFTAVSMAGFPHFQMMSYHFKAGSLMSDVRVPILFAIAMGIDGVVALVVGRLYDRTGYTALAAIPLLSLFLAPLAFSSHYGSAVAGVILWGAAMGVQETIMRAGIADMISATRRGTAYGIFNTAYGVSWFLGSSLMGVLYDVSVPSLVIFSVACELLSFPLLLGVIKKTPRTTNSLSPRGRG